MASKYTVPGLDRDKAEQVATQLQGRLNALIDLQLTLKHIHWNVVGPNFIGVHEMLDPQVEAVRGNDRRHRRAHRDPRVPAGRHAPARSRRTGRGTTTR